MKTTKVNEYIEKKDFLYIKKEFSKLVENLLTKKHCMIQSDVDILKKKPFLEALKHLNQLFETQ